MSSIPLSKEIYEAIKQAVEKYGSESELARQCKLDVRVINRYTNMQVKKMTIEKWDKLEPYIRAFLPENHAAFPKVTNAEESCQFKSRHAKLLVESFEKLDKSNQRALLTYADDVLQEQEQGRPEPLTIEDVEKLREIGIECYHGYELQVSTKGLCWIYNVIEQERAYDILFDNVFISEMLSRGHDVCQFRELHIKAFPVSVYNDTKTYYQYAFYLDGSPPKLYTMHLDNNPGIASSITVYPSLNTPFKVDQYSDVTIVFTEQEMEALKQGKTLRIK